MKKTVEKYVKKLTQVCDIYDIRNHTTIFEMLALEPLKEKDECERQLDAAICCIQDLMAREHSTFGCYLKAEPLEKNLEKLIEEISQDYDLADVNFQYEFFGRLNNLILNKIKELKKELADINNALKESDEEQTKKVRCQYLGLLLRGLVLDDYLNDIVDMTHFEH